MHRKNQQASLIHLCLVAVDEGTHYYPINLNLLLCQKHSTALVYFLIPKKEKKILFSLLVFLVNHGQNTTYVALAIIFYIIIIKHRFEINKAFSLQFFYPNNA